MSAVVLPCSWIAFLTSTQVIMSNSTRGLCAAVLDAFAFVFGAGGFCACPVPARRASTQMVDVKRYIITPENESRLVHRVQRGSLVNARCQQALDRTLSEIKSEPELLGPLRKFALGLSEARRLQRRLIVIK